MKNRNVSSFIESQSRSSFRNEKNVKLSCHVFVIPRRFWQNFRLSL